MRMAHLSDLHFGKHDQDLAPTLAPELFQGRDNVVRTASFCGACTTSDDCGSGWVCCSHGCSDGLKKCYNVVSCDKVDDETGPMRLFASN